MSENVRNSLKKLGIGSRHYFQAEFSGVGFKYKYHGKANPIYLPTLLLVNVICDGEIVSDHIWLNYTKGFIKLGELTSGDLISFYGRIEPYKKGFGPNKKLDYGIKYPSKISLIKAHENNERNIIPYNKNALIGYIMKTNKEYYLKNDRPYDPWYVNQYDDWLKDAN